MSTWLPIHTAPQSCRIIARLGPDYLHFATWWGKASHIPMYGWCVGSDPEDIDLWDPNEWLEGSEHLTDFTFGKYK